MKSAQSANYLYLLWLTFNILRYYALVFLFR